MSIIGYETKAVVTATITAEAPLNTREIGQNTGGGKYPAPVYLLVDLDRDGRVCYLRNDLLAPPPIRRSCHRPRLLVTESGAPFVTVRYAEGDTIPAEVECDGKQWIRAHGWYDDGTFHVFFDPA